MNAETGQIKTGCHGKWKMEVEDDENNDDDNDDDDDDDDDFGSKCLT